MTSPAAPTKSPTAQPAQKNAADFSDIHAVFSTMHSASRHTPAPSAARRISHLKALRAGLGKHGKALVAGVFRDFTGRAPRETLFAEMVPLGASVGHTIKHVRSWMAPERRFVNWTFLPSTAQIRFQPKGVVLIIAPWNYPILLALEPLLGALAAGNRVIIKPSELSPATGKALKAMISDLYDENHVQVITGGVDTAEALTKLPFDHILYTGSTRVGHLVMKAAAENLTPVTLELGGKSPALIHDSYNLQQAAERIAFGKTLNAGQTCIAPDYVLVPNARLEAFKKHYITAVTKGFPKLSANMDYTPIISMQHYERLQDLLDDAQKKGAKVIEIDPANEMPERRRKKLPPSLVFGATDEMNIMNEEIFGPPLPVIGYDTLEHAIALINAKPRPLALYYFDNNSARIDQVLQSTTAGGVTINDTLAHIAQDNLPFGGIGPSGMGSYHGEDGFRTFSHAKSVYRQSRLVRGFDVMKRPWGSRFDKMMKLLTGQV